MLTHLLLAAAGFVAGALNVVAGGGSFLTIPILIFAGLPPTLANATNRVGVLVQNVTAVWGFHRHRVVDFRYVLWAAAPCTVGGLIGAWLALRISDDAFRKVLAVLMIAVTLWTLWDPLGKRRAFLAARERPRVGPLAVGFLLIGVYGGFVQAGVGFLVLAATTAAGLDLVRGNAVKVLAILAATAVSLALFAWQGKVNWTLGLTLAVGTTAGSLLGVRLTVLKGHAWVRVVVTVTVIAFAIKLLAGV